MLGKHLKFLSEVADLARLDFEGADISLVTKERKLYSRYRGAYSSGQRWLTYEELGFEPPELNMAVSAVQFKSLVNLLDEEKEVELELRHPGLRMNSSGSRIDLAERSGLEELDDEMEKPGQSVIQSTVSVLQKEFETASEFAARSMATPVLTGLRVQGSSDGRMAIEASDGNSLFLSRFNVDGSSPFELILPAYDVVLGLKLLREGPVEAFSLDNHFILRGAHGMFNTVSVRGNWPNSAPIRAEVERQEVVEIPAAIIRRLVQSVRILGTSNDLILRGGDGSLLLQTTASESGAFQATLPAPKILGDYIFDVSNFLLALNLGSVLSVYLPVAATGAKTLIKSGNRDYWIAQRLYNTPSVERPMEAAGIALQQD